MSVCGWVFAFEGFLRLTLVSTQEQAFRVICVSSIRAFPFPRLGVQTCYILMHCSHLHIHFPDRFIMFMAFPSTSLTQKMMSPSGGIMCSHKNNPSSFTASQVSPTTCFLVSFCFTHFRSHFLYSFNGFYQNIFSHRYHVEVLTTQSAID